MLQTAIKCFCNLDLIYIVKKSLGLTLGSYWALGALCATLRIPGWLGLPGLPGLLGLLAKFGADLGLARGYPRALRALTATTKIPGRSTNCR